MQSGVTLKSMPVPVVHRPGAKFKSQVWPSSAARSTEHQTMKRSLAALLGRGRGPEASLTDMSAFTSL